MAMAHYIVSLDQVYLVLLIWLCLECDLTKLEEEITQQKVANTALMKDYKLLQEKWTNMETEMCNLRKETMFLKS